MAASKQYSLTDKVMSVWQDQGHNIMLVICILLFVGMLVAIIIMATSDDDNGNDNDNTNSNKPEEPACSRDSDCAESKVCHGKSGCCPKCMNSECTSGMLTAGGCIASPSTQTYGSSHEKPESAEIAIPNPLMSVRGAWANMWMSAFADGTTDNKNTSGYSLDPDAMPQIGDNLGGSIAACRGHSDAFMKTCLGKDPMCCAVCVNGLSFQGVRGPDGTCQTTVQQSGYTGMGQEPPNTYMVSSSGPKYGVAMGGCSVEPVGSSLSMYTGFYQQPQK